MVFVQALLSRRGVAAACPVRCEEKPVPLLLCPPILAEVRDVLGRPAFRNKYRHLTDERVDEFLREVQSLAVHIDDVPSTFSLPRDPKDEPYLNLAIASKASAIVSRD